MNSSYVKTCLMCWLRYGKQISILATEVGRYNSDVLYCDKKNFLHEIEVKISAQDFKADFKKPKHKEFSHPKNMWAPNFFWFAVDPKIAQFALAMLRGSKYGLMVVSPPMDKESGYAKWDERVRVLKKATPIHTRPCSGGVKATIVHRLASEVCTHMIGKWAR